MDEHVELSRRVSEILRHRAWEYGLEPDDDGWVSLGDLLRVLALEGGEVTAAELAAMFANAPRVRHETDGHRVRALYGHSFDVALPRQTDVPDWLYHGTTPSAVGSIQRSGLLPRGRRFVHLAVSTEMARVIGQRRVPDPVLIAVDTAAARAAGVDFRRASPEIVVAAHVPAACCMVA